MRITLAPYIPLVKDCKVSDLQFTNLSLTVLPNYITLLVPDDWENIIYQNASIASDWEIRMLLSNINVKKFSFNRQAQYLNLNPDILSEIQDTHILELTKNQLFELIKIKDNKNIFAGVNRPSGYIMANVNKFYSDFYHFNPNGILTLKIYIDSLVPQLEQLKHNQNIRFFGNNIVSPFSAYDKNDESYAQELLRIAYEDYPGQIDDQTDLYTYDRKNKTFVKFHPNRNNKYHGFDITLREAKKEAPEIVKKFNLF